MNAKVKVAFQRATTNAQRFAANAASTAFDLSLQELASTTNTQMIRRGGTRTKGHSHKQGHHAACALDGDTSRHAQGLPRVTQRAIGNRHRNIAAPSSNAHVGPRDGRSGRTGKRRVSFKAASKQIVADAVECTDERIRQLAREFSQEWGIATTAYANLQLGYEKSWHAYGRAIPDP